MDKTSGLGLQEPALNLLTLKGHSQAAVAGRSAAMVTIATGCLDKTATVWDAKTGDLILNLNGHTGSVSCVSFSPTGHEPSPEAS